jgi:polyphosphate kinase
LLTCEPDITNDSAELFNWLTGVSVFPELKKIKAAPNALHAFVLEMIEREINHAKSGKPAAIFGMINALVDEEVTKPFAGLHRPESKSGSWSGVFVACAQRCLE